MENIKKKLFRENATSKNTNLIFNESQDEQKKYLNKKAYFVIFFKKISISLRTLHFTIFDAQILFRQNLTDEKILPHAP